ncbi:hypothetical protein GQ44DRAFT_731247 [Phaeosphaeriaceae sp. PMI808]|nr:hypothetical protein GQ44DRAFT_731247 [Phaeosphaeriaceae sp. PMI808]
MIKIGVRATASLSGPWPSLVQHAVKQFDKDGPGLIDSTNSLWTILGNAVQDPQAGPIIMVLDAPDECAESEFEDLMQNIENQFRSNQLGHGRLPSKFHLSADDFACNADIMSAQ